MTITTLLTTDDFETTFRIDFSDDSTEDSDDNHQVNLTVNEDNLLTGTVEELDLSGEEVSPVVFTAIDSEMLLNDDPEHMTLAIHLDDGNDNLTGTSENQIILTIIDGNDLADRQFTDPLTGETVDFTDNDVVVAIDSSNNEALTNSEANDLVLEDNSFTLDLDDEVIGVSIEELAVSSDSDIGLSYSSGSSTSPSATEMSVALDDGGELAINQSIDNSTI